MDLKNPPEPAAIKEDQAMVKDVKDDLDDLKYFCSVTEEVR